jgi:hypothetical protein
MKRVRFFLVVLAAACSSKEPEATGRQAPRGLPPLAGATSGTSPTSAPQMANPHAGVDMNSHGGGADPHANVDMTAHGEPGSGGPVDPAMFLEGVLELPAALADKVKPGDTIFMSAKRHDAATKVTDRMPLAAIRIDVDATRPIRFRLDGTNAMIPGTPFTGTVMLAARVDRDREALSREPGDIEGMAVVTIPTKDLKLSLDKPVE